LTAAPGVALPRSANTASPSGGPFATLPKAVDSFGGAVLGEWLYVYGGHTGKVHKYSRETATKHFRRLNLRDRTTWEELPCGPAGARGRAAGAPRGPLHPDRREGPPQRPRRAPRPGVGRRLRALRPGVEDVDRPTAAPDAAVDPRFGRRGRKDLRHRRMVDER